MKHLPRTVGLMFAVALAACEASTPTLSKSAGQARTSIVPAGECNSDCMGVWRAATSWVSETRSVHPSRVLVDTVRSGRKTYAGKQVVPRSALINLMTTAGLGGQASLDAMALCFGNPTAAVPASCHQLEDKIVVRLFAPEISSGTPSEATMDLVEAWTTLPQARGRRNSNTTLYRLTLQLGSSGWRVLGAQVLAES